MTYNDSDDLDRTVRALGYLIEARRLLDQHPKTREKVALAISSARGTVRHAEHARFRAQEVTS